MTKAVLTAVLLALAACGGQVDTSSQSQPISCSTDPFRGLCPTPDNITYGAPNTAVCSWAGDRRSGALCFGEQRTFVKQGSCWELAQTNSWPCE